MAASVWLMNWSMKMYIGARHKLLEDIIRTEEVPKSWSLKFEKKMAHMKDKANAVDNMTKIYEEAQRSYLKRLDQLVKYVKKTRLVQDEETRQTLLTDLELIRKLWKERNNHELHTL
jgi:thioredoxin-like negative regulator of GroEL